MFLRGRTPKIFNQREAHLFRRRDATRGLSVLMRYLHELHFQYVAPASASRKAFLWSSPSDFGKRM